MRRKLLGTSLRLARALRGIVERVVGVQSPVARVVHDAAKAVVPTVLAARIAELETVVERQANSILWLTQQLNRSEHPPPTAATTRISIVMPTYNRASFLPQAIASVRAQTHVNWELLVADDGSSDDTESLVRRLAAEDPRIRYLPGPHRGHATARNRALAEATGELIAYLDSDDVWYPQLLLEVLRAFEGNPGAESAYLAQLVYDPTQHTAFVRFEPFDEKSLERENFIDLNVFVHRRSCVDRYGGFDEKLTRVVDYDLIRRYTAKVPPLRIDALGGRHELGAADSVSARENARHNLYQVQRKWERRIDRPLRVLYALWHYPQLSESYVRWEISYMRRRGVDITVWSELESAPAPFDTDVPVHHGSFASVLARVRPDLVHVHWSNRAKHFRGAAAKLGVPMTVRDHAFDFSTRMLDTLLGDDIVERVYVFPHLAAQLRPNKKLRPMPVTFNGDLYPPSQRKDPLLVFRCAAALATKDLDTFFDAARRCPRHRFVIALVECDGQRAFLDTLLERQRLLGSPVEVLVNVQTEEVADWMARAGIYLHTHGLVLPYGMPISIAEAMATGAYVIGRRCAGSEAYIGKAGALYDDLDGAVALIHATESWSDEQWQRARLGAVDHAYKRYVDLQVLPPMLEDWLAITTPGRRREPPSAQRFASALLRELLPERAPWTSDR